MDSKNDYVQKTLDDSEKLKNYKGPIPAYMPNIDSNEVNFFEKDENEHTAVLDDGSSSSSDEVSSMIGSALNKFKKNADSTSPQDFQSSKERNPLEETQSFNIVLDKNKEKYNIEDTSIIEKYRKFTKNHFDNVNEDGLLTNSEDLDDTYYDEFYEDFEEKLGFFERIKLRNEERKKAKQKQYDSYYDDAEIYYEEDEYIEPEELESDFKSPLETRDKITWLDKIVSSHFKQITILAIITLLSFFVTLPLYTAINPITKFINIESNPISFLIVNLVLVTISLLVNFENVKRGLTGFFKFNSNSDSMLAILIICSMLYNIFLIFRPDFLLNDNIHIYTFFICFAVLFNNISHLIEVIRVRRNFTIISSQKQKNAVEVVTDPELSGDMIKLLGDPDPQIVVPVKTNFLKRFFELSFDDYYGDSIDRTLVPICFALSLALAAGLYFLFNDIAMSISIFFAGIIVSSPLTTLLCTNLPLLRASNKLAPKDTVISGNEAIWDYSQTTSLTVDAKDLFPKGSIVLQGIKTFEGGRIDQAIVDTVSVLHTMDSPLSKTFLEIIENRMEFLKKVDSILYEDEMGVSAWVSDKRILIGNRELMINHGVDVPDRAYDMRYTEGGREIVYFATSGILSAMYVVKYMAETHIADCLFDLNENNVSLIIRTSDPNITALKVSEVFGLNMQNVRVIPERKSGSYERVTEPKPRVDAKVAFKDNILGYLSSITVAVRLAPTISASFLIQTISIVLGFLLVAIMAFFKVSVNLTPFTLLLYNGFWLLIIFIVNAVRQI